MAASAARPTSRGTLTISPAVLTVCIETSVVTVLKSALKKSSAAFSSTRARPSVRRSTLMGSRARSRARSGETKRCWMRNPSPKRSGTVTSGER